MTEAEQREVKTLIEKTVADAARVAAALEAKIAQLLAEVDRKNQALEGFIAENQALKEELAGRKAGGTAPPYLPPPAPHDVTPNGGELSDRVAAKLGKWQGRR
jgi:hypothetical protein